MKDRLSIEDVIGTDVPLSGSGDRLVGRCPFHDDTTPSFAVFPASQSFHCYGCGVSGDVFTWMMRKQSVTFDEALSMLLFMAGALHHQRPTDD